MLALLTIGLAAMQAAAPPRPSAWSIDESDGGCVLKQTLADGTASVELSRSPMSSSTSLHVTQSGVRQRDERTLHAVEVGFANGQRASAEGAVYPDERDRRTIAVELDDGTMTTLSQVQQVTLAHQALGHVPLNIRDLHQVVPALQRCANKHLTAWGMDPASLRALASLPLPSTSPNSWISYDDYPDRQKIYLRTQIIIIRLDVDVAGRASACTILNPDAPTEFKDAACKALLKRARFTPARDAQGAAVAAPTIMRIGFAPVLL